MLVCHVVQLARRAAIAADLAESANAADQPGTGNVVFATLVDDPASVRESVDAFLGQIMVEAASANSTVNAGLAYAVAIAEAAHAAELLSSVVPASAIIAEAASAVDAPDATKTVTITYATWNPSDLTNTTLSNGNLTATVPTGAATSCRADTGLSSGKYYFEYTNVTLGASINYGLGLANVPGTSGDGINSAGTVGVTVGTSAIWVNGSNIFTSIDSIAGSGNILGIAVDLGAKLIWFRAAPTGNWNGSGTANPATGTGGLSISALALPLYPYLGWIGSSTGQITTANFGASAFSGTVPSGFTAGWHS